MSGGESKATDRRTRGKGSRKAGRGPDDDMEDTAESEAAEDAQQMIDEIEDQADDRPAPDPAESQHGEESDSSEDHERVVGSLSEREQAAIRSLLYTASRVAGRAWGAQEDDVVDAALEAAYDHYEEDPRDDEYLRQPIAHYPDSRGCARVDRLHTFITIITDNESSILKELLVVH